MRKPKKRLEDWRVTTGSMASDASFGNTGQFLIPIAGESDISQWLRVQVSDGLGWDHVSVSLPDRCPTWEEMSYIKRLFFRGNECAMQLHPPESKHVNTHNFCLHLWRPQEEIIPMPPMVMV